MTQILFFYNTAKHFPRRRPNRHLGGGCEAAAASASGESFGRIGHAKGHQISRVVWKIRPGRGLPSVHKGKDDEEPEWMLERPVPLFSDDPVRSKGDHAGMLSCEVNLDCRLNRREVPCRELPGLAASLSASGALNSNERFRDAGADQHLPY
jgi:hypothetical protein